ncbi:MAG: hypothetical protein ACYC0M_15340 [Burkholderiales bacterium]
MTDDTHELRIAMLEKQSQRIDDTLQKLADDMHKLTGFSIQQAEDRSALRRAFDQIDTLDSKIDELKEQFDTSAKATLIEKNTEQQRQLDEVKESRKIAFGELIKTALLIIGALIAGHWGGKWI